MIYLQADEEWLVKDLGRFVEPVEITDANGKLLGLFVPANLERGRQLYEQAAAETDWAEIERRRQYQGPWVPAADVARHLELLEQECDRRKAAGEKELTPDEAVAFVEDLRKADQGKIDRAG